MRNVQTQIEISALAARYERRGTCPLLLPFSHFPCTVEGLCRTRRAPVVPPRSLSGWGHSLHERRVTFLVFERSKGCSPTGNQGTSSTPPHQPPRKIWLRLMPAHPKKE
eukprot:3556006-Amphidinium_carterae.1